MKKEKFLIPVAIVFASLILSFGYYAVQVQKQESIERQQTIEIEAEMADKEVQREQEQREYIVERKKDCYEIEQAERNKYNNVDGNGYIAEDDVCIVRYINKSWREGDPIFGVWDEEAQEYMQGKYSSREF